MPRRAWRHARTAVHRRTAHLPANAQGVIWMVVSGVFFTLLNALTRGLSLQLDPYQTQFLRYLFGTLVLVPWILHLGPSAFKPQHVGSHFLRGGLHPLGLWMWFSALPNILLADTTAIGFTGPIFVMLGAYWWFKEPMRWERWLATGLGFAGVMVVVWPKLSWSAALGGGSGGGSYTLGRQVVTAAKTYTAAELNSSPTQVLSVACPAGKVASGGGGGLVSPNPFQTRLVTSKPTADLAEIRAAVEGARRAAPPYIEGIGAGFPDSRVVPSASPAQGPGGVSLGPRRSGLA
mgnify:CR=1 FL=1